MPRVRDLLYRFRPSGAPGAATDAGVPVDRAVEATTELEPVFAQLAETGRDCALILEQARREADATVARDAERARSVLAAGRALVEAERASAEAQTGDRGHAATRVAQAAAEQEVAELRMRAELALPGYIDQVVTSVRSLLAADTGAAHHPDGAT